MDNPINIYDMPEFPLAAEHVSLLLESGDVRAERIVSQGHTSGWYDQYEHEFVLLISGQAIIEYETRAPATLHAGDTLFIAAHERHRVAFTSDTPPCIWVCFFWK